MIFIMTSMREQIITHQELYYVDIVYVSNVLIKLNRVPKLYVQRVGNKFFIRKMILKSHIN